MIFEDKLSSSLYFTGGPEVARVISTQCEKEKSYSTFSKIIKSASWHKKYFELDTMSIRMQVRFSSKADLKNHKIIFLDELFNVSISAEYQELYFETSKRPYRFRWKNLSEYEIVCGLLSLVAHRKTLRPLLVFAKRDSQVQTVAPTPDALSASLQHKKKPCVGLGDLRTKQAIFAKVVAQTAVDPNVIKELAVPYSRGSTIWCREIPIKEPVHDPSSPEIEVTIEKPLEEEVKVEAKLEEPMSKTFSLRKLIAPREDCISQPPQTKMNNQSISETASKPMAIRPLRRQLSISILNKNDPMDTNKPETPLVSPFVRDKTTSQLSSTAPGISGSSNILRLTAMTQPRGMASTKLSKQPLKLQLSSRNPAVDSDSDD